MQLSPQQSAAIEWARTGSGSCVLEAVAGAGKTFVLTKMAALIKGDVLAVVFAKRNAAEMTAKMRPFANVTVSTVHSAGFKAYRDSQKRVTVERNKLRNLADATLHDTLKHYSGMICKLVSLAKQRGLGVFGDISDLSQWRDIADHFDVFSTRDDRQVPEDAIILAAERLLRASIKQLDIIDFDDQVYMPLVLNMPFRRYDVVMVDEAQDTNPTRRELVKRSLKAGGRVIAVGDRHQAIFGFTGADNDSLDLIRTEFNAIDMPLTTTYRCPKAVVAFAQQWVSHIHAHASAPEGKVTSIPYDDFMARANQESLSAVLCRNTKPLVALAMTLIRNRVACKVEGRDIGAGLIKLATKWKVKSLDVLRDKLDTYKTREIAKLEAKKKDHMIQQLEDTVDTLLVIIDQCQSVGKNSLDCVTSYVEDLFADDVEGMLTLSTIHKSKGREWKRVFWLDRSGTCPSKYARQQWQLDQETNLMYVAATRAQEELTELSAPVAGAPKKPVQAPAPAPVQVTTGLTKEEQRKADKARRAKARREARKG